MSFKVVFCNFHCLYFKVYFIVYFRSNCNVANYRMGLDLMKVESHVTAPYKLSFYHHHYITRTRTGELDFVCYSILMMMI